MPGPALHPVCDESEQTPDHRGTLETSVAITTYLKAIPLLIVLAT